MTVAWDPAADPWGGCRHGLPAVAFCPDCEGIVPEAPADVEAEGITPGPADPTDLGKRGPSIATRLVEYAREHHTLGWSADGSGPFAVAHGSHLTLPLRGGRNSLRAAMARAAHELWGMTPSASALADALTVLEGYCQAAPALDVHLRAAHRDGVAWLDLGDESGRAVRITANGWEVADRAPVLFRRTELTGALPTPARGGDLAALWRFANVREDLRPLVAAWLVAVLLPDRPCPVVALLGEQGTGKSTATRLLGGLLDPSPAATRKPPRDVEAWVVAAAGSRVVAIDNLSSIPEWFSDSLCRASTGDGDVRRTLYSDGGLTVFSFRRAVVLNGIDLGALRPDLADRLLPISLERIPEAGRICEQDLPGMWAASWPKILGAVLDLASAVLADLATHPRPDRLPRMADFARVLNAIERLMGGAVVATYTSLGDEMAGDAVTLDPVLAALVAEVRAPWEGSATALLELLDVHRPTPVPREWPRTARSVAGHLIRHAPALRRLGWTVERGKDARGKVTAWALCPPLAAGVLPGSTPAQGTQPRQFANGIGAGREANAPLGADVAGVAGVTPPLLLLRSDEEEVAVPSLRVPARITPATPATPATPPAMPLSALLSPCAGCGLPSLTTPCTACRRETPTTTKENPDHAPR